MLSSHIFIFKYYLRILEICALRSLDFEHTCAAKLLITSSQDIFVTDISCTVRHHFKKVILLDRRCDARLEGCAVTRTPSASHRVS